MSDKLLEGLKLGHLRKELKSIRKEYYKPLSKMSRAELLAEHGRHKGLAKGDTTTPEKVFEEKVVEKKSPAPMVQTKKMKVIPGLPQAMGTGVGAATREGGKALGEPAGKPKKTKEHLVPAPAPAPAPSSGKSAYNSFVAQHRREGKSMAEIGAMWRGMK